MNRENTLRHLAALSPSAMSPINPQIRAGHEAARIAEQEDCCASILFWSAQSVHHVLGLPKALAFWMRFEQLCHHGRPSVPRRERVHADLVLGPLHCQVAP